MDDNLADYADPLLYDEENADFEPDGPMFLALARRFGNPILELGCGTGRLTLPLARAGLDITGIDVVNGMLERARANARDVSVAYIEADVRTLDLGREFRLIFESGATFQHLLTQNDQTAMLRRVREHLAPGGRFVVSVTLPTPELTKSELEEQPWYAYEAADGRRVRVSGTQEYDPTTKIKTETAYRRWQSAVAGEVVQIAPFG